MIKISKFEWAITRNFISFKGFLRTSLGRFKKVRIRDLTYKLEMRRVLIINKITLTRRV